jgi:hypothetical protein
VSLEAAAPPPSGAYHPHHLRGHSHGRLRLWGSLAIFGVTFAVIVGIATGLSSVAAPPSQPAVCQPFQPCGGPPAVTRRLVALTVWKAARSGYSLEYDPNLFGIASQNGSALTLGFPPKAGSKGVVAVRADAGASPSTAIATTVGALRANISQLARDTSPADELLGPAVGLRPGSGAVYKGVLAGPQGVSQAVVLAVESATDGHMTITAAVLATPSGSGPQSALYSLADRIINSVKWPGAPHS